jgi:hypothetical protein
MAKTTGTKRSNTKLDTKLKTPTKKIAKTKNAVDRSLNIADIVSKCETEIRQLQKDSKLLLNRINKNLYILQDLQSNIDLVDDNAYQLIGYMENLKYLEKELKKITSKK